MQVVRYAAGEWGVGELWLDGAVPVWHELPSPSAVPQAPDRGGSLPEVARRVAAYFAGERVSFADVGIDLEWCTPFQLSVARTLQAVPYGETVSYGELAALAGHPNAQRAVGTFCAQNRLPLFLPCHRVVAADGVGSYGSLGVEYKRRLLELERAAL